MKIAELLVENNVKLQIRSDDSKKAKEWIEKIYSQYHIHPLNQMQRIMVWGEGEHQQMAIFELTPSLTKSGAVEIKWFQAYPRKEGIGKRAMQELQKKAHEDGITLTLFPWDKGQLTQAALIKIYKKMGFIPLTKGSKSMVWSPPEKVTEAAAGSDLKEKYKRWKELINMPTSMLKKFLETDDGKDAGLSRKEASKLGIGTGRDSARAILRMRDKPLSEWSDDDIRWMGRQISFVSRMTGNDGPLYKKDSDGKKIPTRKLTSLLVWGNIPSGISVRIANGQLYIS